MTNPSASHVCSKSYRGWALVLASGFTASCVPVETPALAPIVVERVDAPRYTGTSGDPLEIACAAWRLSPAQVEAFFRHSNAFDTMPVAQFYQVPCSISGALLADGQRWDFVIDGGATATWRSGEATRYWGCMARDCETLVLLPYDGMSGDL